MKTVIQRVSKASITIGGTIKSEIKSGLLILLGVEATDNTEDIVWLSRKITQLRIFKDKDENMNLCVKDIEGDIVVVSQFTLHASTKKGNRPSFMNAAKPEIAIPLYEQFIAQMEKDLGKDVQSGTFGADIKVELINDGPVTIIIDSKKKS